RHQPDRVRGRVPLLPRAHGAPARDRAGPRPRLRHEGRGRHDGVSAEDAPARPKGYLYVVGAALLWGTIGVFSKRVLEHGVAAVEIAFWRAALAGAAFLVQAVIARTLRLQRPADALGLAAFALIGVSLFYTA